VVPCAVCSRARTAVQVDRIAALAHTTVNPPFSAIMSGSVVTFTLSGYQPDFDPIDRVIISAHLRSAGVHSPPVPDTLVVLYLYLENFLPTTTPLLPDLLHPNQQAQNLGGFLSGKASFVNASGHELYRGGVLAEVFLDNSVHMIVDVFHPADAATARSQRLTSTFTLFRNLSVKGALNAKTRLSLGGETPPGGAAHFPSWQSVVSKLTVIKPVQYGLTDKHLLPAVPGLTGSRSITASPGLGLNGTITVTSGLTSSNPIVATPGPNDSAPTPFIVGGALVAVILVGLGAALLRRRRRQRGAHGASSNA